MKKAKTIRFLVFLLLLIIPMQATGFSDVKEGDTYYFELTYLKDEGVLNGYDDGTVKPNKKINRAELVKILVEGVENKQPNSSQYKNCFPDVGTQWFAPYVCYAYEQGWIEGYKNGKFKPEKNINKVEALKIILNAFDVEVKIPTNSSGEWYEPYLEKALDKNIFSQKGNPDSLQTRGEVSEIVALLKQLAYMGDESYTDVVKAEFQTFYLINELREENGITQQLKLNPKLTEIARQHAKDMAENFGELSHKSSNGDGLQTRLDNSGAYYWSGGENIGMSTISSKKTVYEAIVKIHDNIFMEEPDDEQNHKSNILGTFYSFEEVGIGVYVKDDVMYFAVDFIGT